MFKSLITHLLVQKKESILCIPNRVDIETPKDIVIDCSGILKPTGTTYTVPVGTSSENIQKMIDSMSSGDTLSFEENGVYENISIYIAGSSWGIFLQYNKNATITNNHIHDQYTTGLINFGSANTIIANNTVTNAVNHGIDVRHRTGPNATVFNNTVIGAKEGIYLMHSQNHTVYNNTIINCTLSSITAYGSGNEAIFNNTLTGSRIGIIVGGGYYNVTIGPNNYNLNKLAFPPTFSYYIVQVDSKYQSATNAQGTYYDSAKEPKAVIIADDITMYYKNGTKLHITLKDNNGYNLANANITVTIIWCFLQ